MTDFEESAGYIWETEDENNLSNFDKNETFSDLVHRVEIDRKRKIQKRPSNIRLGMMRYTLLFIDMTESMKIIDMKPTRLSSTIKNAKTFVESYFDQNPISQLGIFIIKNAAVEKLTCLGTNPKKHLEALQSLSEDSCEGEPSLENILLCAENTLKHIPSYATREIIIVMASVTTCDHDNIHDIIASVQSKHIRCSVIHLVCEVFVYKKLTKVTSGLFQVVLDEADMRYRFQNLVLPPPSIKENEASLIHMGFPSCKRYNPVFKTCSCHNDIRTDVTQLYSCPRCKSGYCEVPTECNVCGLILVSYPHLARSYHHLFPLDTFKEQKANETEEGDMSFKCSSCSIKISKEETIHTCKSCAKIYCSNCDDFLHSSVHVCPNCSEKPIRIVADFEH